MSTFTRAAAGKEVVIVEEFPGPANQPWNRQNLPAKIIGVEAYAEDYTVATGFYKPSGKQLAGVILNKVRYEDWKRQRRFLRSYRYKSIGTVPEERTLTSITVAGLAQEIKGRLSARIRANALIEM